MNKDQVSGATDEAKGKVKEGFGKLTGDKSTQASGLVDQAKGKLKKVQGDAKDELNKEADKDDV